VTSPHDDRDALIAELYEEAHGLRMKLEEFSRYTEDAMAKMAAERREHAERYSTMERDMSVRETERRQLQHEVVRCREEIARLTAEIDRLRTSTPSVQTRRWGRRSR
jgi:predicted  nucleic acid-binding Zn-ribbon protein